jgi:transposase-like protein
MAHLTLRHKAIKLRKQGKTYSEIQRAIGPLAKSTLSNWLKQINLTKTQKIRILKKISDAAALGRQKGGWKNHQKRLERIARIQTTAVKEFSLFSKNPFFLTGLILYLSEGARKIERFQFMNSDPYLVKIMIKWLCLFGKITKKDIKARLYTHKLYTTQNHEKFWSCFLNIPASQFLKTIYKPTPHKIKKNFDHKGCIRIEISGSELFWKIMKWRDILYKSF